MVKIVICHRQEVLKTCTKKQEVGKCDGFCNLLVSLVLPLNYMIDGAKFELQSAHSQNFQTSHAFGWGSAQSPSTYHFGAMYATNQVRLLSL
jgi:hypothetical protein